MEVVFAVLKMAWGFFSEIECPFLGISFASLFLGVFVVSFSVRILRPLLGIGGSIAGTGEKFYAKHYKASEKARIESQRAGMKRVSQIKVYHGNSISKR